jgi:hypothetical protein
LKAFYFTIPVVGYLERNIHPKERSITMTSIRDSMKQTYLGYLDALLEKKDMISSLSLEELTKVATIGRAACNNCCNGSTGMALEEEALLRK